MVKKIVCFSRFLDREMLDKHLDLSRLCETDYFHQLRDVSPVGCRDRAFFCRAMEVNWNGSASETYDGQVAQDPSQLAGHCERRVDANHVEYEFGSMSARHVLNARDSIIARNKHLIGAHILGDLELVFRGVNGDDGCRAGQHSQDLDCHLAEPTGSDNHRS